MRLRSLILLSAALIPALVQGCTQPALPSRAVNPATTPSPAAAIVSPEIEALIVKARAGDAHAMYELGRDYQSARGITRDLAQGEDWLKKAAAAGNARAMDYLGDLYHSAGGGIVADNSQAIQWYRKAADAGLAIGMMDLGYFYEHGYGVSKDPDQAKNISPRRSNEPRGMPPLMTPQWLRSARCTLLAMACPKIMPRP